MLSRSVVPTLCTLLLIAGCVRYTPAPLDSPDRARQFEKRRLTDPGLTEFVLNTGEAQPGEWPPNQWDLEALSLAAFYFNPDLSTVRAELASARAAGITAGQRPDPDLSGSAGTNTTSKKPTPWILGFGLDWTIETAGKRGARKDQAAAETESREYQVASVAWEIRSGILSALVEMQIAGRRRRLLEEESRIRQELLRRANQRVEAGEISSYERSLIRIEAGRSEIAIREAAEDSMAARIRLAGAIGVPSEALDDVRLVAHNLPTDFPTVSIPDVRDASLSNRADILASLADYEASEAALRLEIARQYPDLRLGPGYEYDQGDHKWSLGLGLAIPVLSGNRGPIAQAKAARSEQAARFGALQADILEQVDQVVAAYNGAKNRLGHIESMLDEAHNRVIQAQAQRDAGLIAEPEFLQARLETNAVELEKLTVEAELRQALNELEYTQQAPLGFQPLSWQQDFLSPQKPSSR